MVNNVRPAVVSDLVKVLGDIGFDDEMEAATAGFDSAFAGGMVTFSGSTEVECLEVGGEVLAVFGIFCHALTDAEVFPWALITREAKKNHPVTVLRTAKKIFKHWTKKYKVMAGFVNADYYQAQHWLVSLGFTLSRVSHMNGIEVMFFEWRVK